MNIVAPSSPSTLTDAELAAPLLHTPECLSGSTHTLYTTVLGGKVPRTVAGTAWSPSTSAGRADGPALPVPERRAAWGQ